VTTQLYEPMEWVIIPIYQAWLIKPWDALMTIQF
jgi:hypothetical protein